MNATIDNEAPVDEIIEEILRRADSLPSTQEKCVRAVQEIGMMIRWVARDVMYTQRPIVEGWIAKLNDVPTKIGLRIEFDAEAQRIVHGIREEIANRLDIQWPKDAGTGIVAEGDSGIDLIPREWNLPT